jgi:hypothetical protein
VQLGADTIENITLSKTSPNLAFQVYEIYFFMDGMDKYDIEADARSVESHGDCKTDFYHGLFVRYLGLRKFTQKDRRLSVFMTM